jgi:thioredoxin-like negative regulator of GroEL
MQNARADDQQVGRRVHGRVKFVEVNAEDEPTLTSKLKVNSLPTVVLYKNGAAAQSAVGLQSEKALRTLLDSHL